MNWPPKVSAAFAQERRLLEEQLRSDDPQERVTAALRVAVLTAWRETVTMARIQGTPPDMLGLAVAETIGNLLAIAAGLLIPPNGDLRDDAAKKRIVLEMTPAIRAMALRDLIYHATHGVAFDGDGNAADAGAIFGPAQGSA